MRALVDYIEWVSTAEPARKPFVGRGLLAIRDMTPDVDRGKAIYAEQCAGCHGENGEGRPNVFPPLWGPDSFNDGAGMHGVKKMAAFVQHNMPQNRMGILTPQEAWDVAAYVHQQPRPPFNKAYARY
jgi:thiosulfate dehydrogenase